MFWEHPTGEVMIAPHTGMRPFPGWRKVECQTTGDIDRYSRRLEAQEENKLRGLKIEEQLRSMHHWDRIISNCKLRLAQGCISAADELVTRRTMKKMEDNHARFHRLVAGEINLSKGALEIERKEAKVGLAAYSDKKVVF